MSDANLSLLSRSSWIWPEGNFYLNNCYAQFRYDFELEEVPEKAPFLISADEFYRLYVNGRYICRGPARGYQESWPYDEVDLSAVLRKGHNWISVEAYNPGLGTCIVRNGLRRKGKTVCSQATGLRKPLVSI